MTNERRNKMAMPVVFTLLTLALVGSPASAGQDLDPVTPLVTIFALGALLYYDRAAQHYHLYLGKDAMLQDPGRNRFHGDSFGEFYEEIHFSRL